MDFKTIESDVVVVGAGIAGALASYQVASKGRTVCIIDRGIRLSPDLVESIFECESFIGHPGVPLLSVEFSENSSAARPIPSVVGGLARFYASVSLRMREREFDKWPFSYNDIEPYYTQAEKLMQVSGNTGTDPTEPRRSKPFPFALPKMSNKSYLLSLGAEKLGLKPFQHPFAIRFDPDCKRCNYCNQVPCPYGVKWNPDTFLANASELPIKVYQETCAEKIHWIQSKKDRRIDYIECRNMKDGSVLRFYAKHFVLAGGAILTPKLMIQSRMREWNPLTGTHLMTHCLGLVVGLFPFQVSEEGDFHKWWSVSDYYFEDNGEVRGLIQQDHLTARKKVFAKAPKLLHPVISKFYYNTCQIMVIAEDEPLAESRIELNRTGAGAGVELKKKFTEKDESKRDYLAQQSKKIFKRAGALFTHAFKGKSVYHSCGTCRMGNTISDSVTDARGLVWGTQNLYVADASLFTTSSGVNPGLTIAANSLRVADLIPS